MNAEELRSTLSNLLNDEQEISIQTRLNDLNNALSNLVSQPQVGQHQVEMSTSLNDLRTAIVRMELRIDPARLQRIREISGEAWFSSSMLDIIDESIASNQISPAVVQQLTQQLVGERQNYLQHIQSVRDGLKLLGINESVIAEGTAEIGFRIPRSLFFNELKGLISELSAVQQIIRTFAEIATGSVEPIEVHQISTSDPIFFFGLDVHTVAMIGGAVTWALDAWKRLEGIRHLRHQTRQLAAVGAEELETMFEAMIKNTIAAEIQNHAKVLLPIEDGEVGRKQELVKPLNMALESIFARVERGMTVEIRFLPPPAVEGGAESELVTSFQELKDLVPKLTFPVPDPEPVLALPKPSGGEVEGGAVA